MKDSQIVMGLVGMSVATWLLLALAIFLLPLMGYAYAIQSPLLAHPVALVFAAFLLTSISVKATDQPGAYGRALKLSVIARAFVFPAQVNPRRKPLAA